MIQWIKMMSLPADFRKILPESPKMCWFQSILPMTKDSAEDTACHGTPLEARTKVISIWEVLRKPRCRWLVWIMTTVLLIWLVVWLPFFIFPYIGLRWSSQLTNSIIFQRGGPGLPTNVYWKYMEYMGTIHEAPFDMSNLSCWETGNIWHGLAIYVIWSYIIYIATLSIDSLTLKSLFGTLHFPLYTYIL